YAEAGFTEIALVQIGGEAQLPYLDWAESTLLPALRDALG
ncbi:LLM class F420-dependent oxidoreductase, partial [Streptomyces chartreusis]